ncbi:MAG: tetratricopeptide repeat protein, partial [Actinomycetota bacterium]
MTPDEDSQPYGTARGLQELLQGDARAFAMTLEDLVRDDPNAAVALGMVAAGVVAEDAPEKREAVLGALADRPMALSALVQSAIAAGRGADARSWVDKLARHRQNDGPIQELSARVALATGDAEASAAAAERIIARWPESTKPLWVRAQARQQLGDLAGAEADYAAVIALDPSSAEAWTGRGVVREFQSDYEGALADYEEALKRTPEVPNAWRNRADAHLGLEHFEQAEADYTKAIELDPDFVEAYLGRARARTAANRYVEALADFDRVLDANPDHEARGQRALVHAMMGTAAAGQGQQAEAGR